MTLTPNSLLCFLKVIKKPTASILLIMHHHTVYNCTLCSSLHYIYPLILTVRVDETVYHNLSLESPLNRLVQGT